MAKKILSICIPTYNRAQSLDETLNSITSQEVFKNSNEVEVVVIDNFSLDNTPEIVEKYSTKFPTKIKYIRNNKNIHSSDNHKKALDAGAGEFLKLHNDNLPFLKNSLEEILGILKANLSSKPTIFFKNGNYKKNREIVPCDNMDEFVKEVSFYCTWIGGFGTWKSEYKKLKNPFRYGDLMLPQTDMVLRLIAKSGKGLVCSKKYFEQLDVKNKSGYNVAEVFGQNYLFLYKEHLESDVLNKEVFQAEKKRVLFKQIIPYYFDFDKQHNFKKTGYLKYLKDYYSDWFFYYSFLKIVEMFVSKKIKRKIKKFQENQYKKKWKQNNKHNDTRVINKFDQSKVVVGNHSYGGLKVITWGSPKEGLEIGHLVSIGDDVTFVLGGNHPYTGFSTYPFKVKFFKEPTEAETKGPIIVEDDVWIGMNCMILSGITIGKGSIVCTGSLVTKDVEPYSVVGGVPAKFINHRFEPSIVKDLSKLDFSKISAETVAKNKNILYQDITEGNVKDIVKKLSN